MQFVVAGDQVEELVHTGGAEEGVLALPLPLGVVELAEQILSEIQDGGPGFVLITSATDARDVESQRTSKRIGTRSLAKREPVFPGRRALPRKTVHARCEPSRPGPVSGNMAGTIPAMFFWSH